MDLPLAPACSSDLKILQTLKGLNRQRMPKSWIWSQYGRTYWELHDVTFWYILLNEISSNTCWHAWIAQDSFFWYETLCLVMTQSWLKYAQIVKYIQQANWWDCDLKWSFGVPLLSQSRKDHFYWQLCFVSTGTLLMPITFPLCILIMSDCLFLERRNCFRQVFAVAEHHPSAWKLTGDVADQALWEKCECLQSISVIYWLNYVNMQSKPSFPCCFSNSFPFAFPYDSMLGRFPKSPSIEFGRSRGAAHPQKHEQKHMMYGWRFALPWVGRRLSIAVTNSLGFFWGSLCQGQHPTKKEAHLPQGPTQAGWT